MESQCHPLSYVGPRAKTQVLSICYNDLCMKEAITTPLSGWVKRSLLQACRLRNVGWVACFGIIS